ncbi:hypothetical protein QQZ08_011579 [Neonectria magnoliae]|uniref:Aminoglycoside phosphotransferase domain-containing protein n=1 Tax=Neonectria magnoliae TaxID=2732573 RepID=A0ABR1H9L2_9HYPO
MSAEFAKLLLASEAATLKYIRTHTSIPVPEVFQYSSSSNNNIGVPYILMSKASGQKLSTFNWPWFTLEMPSRRQNSLLPLTTEGGEKVMRQLGAIAAELSQVRFNTIGSLFEDEDGYTIKGCLSPSHTCYGRDSLTIDRGPFDKESDYHKSLVSANVLHAKTLPMDTHCFFAPLPVPDDYSKWSDYKFSTNRWNDFMTIDDKINSGKNRLDYCIASQLAQDMIPSLLSQSYPFGFPLRHFDLSVNNIFVDEDMNITCVIDWAFSSSVPFVELLTTPGMPYPRELPDQSLVTSYRVGYEQTSAQKPSWEDTEKVWHFQRLLCMDSLQDYSHFQRLYSLVAKEELPNIPVLFQDARKAASLELLEIPSNNRAEKYFSTKSTTNREAVARKLTVMMQLNKSFVADRKLWQWLVDALEPEL